MTCLECGLEVDGEIVSYEKVDGVWTTVGAKHYACRQNADWRQFRADHRLTTRLMLDAIFNADQERYGEIRADVARVNAAVKKFESEVWFDSAPVIGECKYTGRPVRARVNSSLQTFVESFQSRASGKSKEVEMLTFISAGCVVITLQTSGADVTLIAAEGEQTERMGLQGINATAAEAVALIEAMAHWRAFDVKPNDHVRLM